MRTIGHFLGISKQTEVLFLVLAGICCTIFDASLFNLHTNLYKVWSAPMDPTKFTDTAQLYVKYILSSIVLVRTFTVHLYLAFYIVMLWPAIFEEKACLLIPWLIVGAVKCLAMGAMSFSTGMYICLAYRFSKAACWDFLIAQIIDQGPSIYMWFCILSYYYDISRKNPDVLHLPLRRTSSIVFTKAERKRKLSLPDSKLKHSFDDGRQLISVSAIDTVINKLSICLRRGASRSLDSMLDRLTAEAQKEEILSALDENQEEDKNLSIAERTLKMLNLSKSYVSEAQSNSTPGRSLNNKKEKKLVVRSNPMIKQSEENFLKVTNAEQDVLPKKSETLSFIIAETVLQTTGFAKGHFNIDLDLDGISDDTSVDSAPRRDFTPSEAIKKPKVEVEALHLNIFDDKASEDVHLEESYKDIRLTPKLTFADNHSERNIEVEELHMNRFDDSISENTKFDVNGREDTVTLPARASQADESRAQSVPSELSKLHEDTRSSQQVSSSSKAPLAVNRRNKEKKIETKKMNQKTLSTSKAGPKSPKSIPQNLKSRSQDTNYNKVSLPTFKHDGYTLAYMESQQRKAAADIMKNRKRPSSSGV